MAVDAAFGAIERRTAPLLNVSARNSATGDGRIKLIGHASVFGSPSVEMQTPLGAFTEYIQPGAFDAVLRTAPDVLLLWDHDPGKPLARTTAGTLELRTNPIGLRYFASITPTSYAEDLRSLMSDGVITGSSFSFRVAPGGEDWSTEGSRVVRRITEISDLYDVTVTSSPAYPAADSALVRSRAINYATERGYLPANPDVSLRVAKLRAELRVSA